MDLKGEELNGTFYEGELQKVSYVEDKFIEIEKVLNKGGKGNGEESLVKWKGWPDKFNTWIHSNTIPT